jgi:hypothetical protein
MTKKIIPFLIMLCLMAAPYSLSAAENCLTCHEGIEDIADVPAMKALSCTFCHKGTPGPRAWMPLTRGFWPTLVISG